MHFKYEDVSIQTGKLFLIELLWRKRKDQISIMTWLEIIEQLKGQVLQTKFRWAIR